MFQVVLGEGGGVAGTWEGYTIWGDGVVAAWAGRGARENEHDVGRLPADTMCALWDAARPLALIPGTRYSGNLIRMLKVTMHDTTHNYSWAPAVGITRTKSAYQEFYERCQSAIQFSLKKK